MLHLIEANWIVFVVALLIGVAVAWWVFARGSTVPAPRKGDALDEGAEPARRNQALIDAVPAAELVPPAGAGLMAGIGEVIAVAAQDEVEEYAARKSAAPTPRPVQEGEGADDLQRIKGVGPKLATLLTSLGVTRFEQIAAWTEADLDRIDAQLGSFAGRPRRDGWIEQAALLASGDTAAYEEKFGKL